MAPIVVAIIAMSTLPESIKFLSLKRERHARLVRQIERMQPGLNLDPNSNFIIGDEVNKREILLRRDLQRPARLDHADVLAVQCRSI